MSSAWLRGALGLLAAGLALLGLWAIAAALVAKPFLPNPATTFGRLAGLLESGLLLPHVGVSLRRICLATLLAAFPAILLGLAAGRNRLVGAVVSPLLYLLHPIPKIAFLPVIMLIFGLDDLSKVLIIALIIFSQLLFSARDAASRIPIQLVDAMRSLGSHRRQLWWHVVLPHALPELLTALRISLGTSLAVLFFSETFATSEGLGWFVMDAWTRVDYPDMYAAILSLGLIGWLLFVLLDLVEQHLCRWKR